MTSESTTPLWQAILPKSAWPEYIQFGIQQAALRRHELPEMQDARTSLIAFTQTTYPTYLAEPFHHLIAEKLEAVLFGKIKRLMIFAPPQHGKSELVSVRFPAYWLGHRPNDPVILSSYSADLAVDKSRQARQVVESDTFHLIFPEIKTDQTNRGVEHWNLAMPNRGGLKAAGVGGPITGFGAMLGVIDDPFKNYEEASSVTIRENVWTWYRSTFRTRIWENGAIILIMTRWHQDDLGGRLLLDKSENWDVVRIPALAETQEERNINDEFLGLPIDQRDPLGRQPKEPACPKRFSFSTLQTTMRAVGSQLASALYQGVPRPTEGGRLKREWFEVVDHSPSHGQRIRYWDNAATQDAGKRTAGVLLNRIGGSIYVEDSLKGQWGSKVRNETILQTAHFDREQYGHVKIWIELEPGSAGKDAAQSLASILFGFDVHFWKETGDKDVRLEGFAAQAESRNVKLVRGAWNREYVDELAAVPTGTFRDQADATAGAFNRFVGRQDMFFPMWNDEVHVVPPMELRNDCAYFSAFKYGFSNPLCYLIGCMDKEGHIRIVRELYGTEKSISETAKAISALEKESPRPLETRLASKELWTKYDGSQQKQNRAGTDDSVAITFSTHGIDFVRAADEERVSGWATLRELLDYSEVRKPRLRISEDCPNLIRTLPEVTHSKRKTENRIEDIDIDGETAAVEALRLLILHIVPPTPPTAETTGWRAKRLKQTGKRTVRFF